MLFNQIKYYVMAFITALFAALGIYAKVLMTKNENLKNELQNQEAEIKAKDTLAKKNKEIKQADEKQNDIINNSNAEKEKVDEYVNDIMTESNNHDVTGVI